MVALERQTKATQAGEDYDVAIDNPLTELSYDQVDEYADQFSQAIYPERTAEQKELFRKAASIARDGWKGNWLTPQERKVFEQEKDKTFWDQPKPLKVTVATLCISAVVQGWLQTGSNGANQNWPTEFGIVDPDSTEYFNPSSGKWIYAGVNAITFFAASLFGCWLSDPLHSKFLGRRGAIFVSGAICFAGVIGAACTHTWQALLICRLIIGLGMGAKASVTPIFGAEVSPSHLRGALVMNWQLFDALGIFLGYTANLIVKDIGKLKWRFQFASAALPLLCLLTLVLTIPESPRWLLKQGRIRSAYSAMRLLRESDLQAATQLLYANAQLQQEARYLPTKQQDAEMLKKIPSTDPRVLDKFQQSVKSSNYWTRLAQLFRDPRTKRATLAAAVVMLGQQMCGINIISFYGSTFFRDVGKSNKTGDSALFEADNRALFLSWGTGLANFLFTFPAYWFIDRRGRLWLLLTTFPGMILSMLAAALSFLAPELTTRNALVGVFMYIFIFFYAAGQGPVAFAYSSEVFPLSNREAGMSFAVFVNLFGAGLLAMFVPLANADNKSQARLLGLFTAFNIIMMVLIFFFVPETSVAVRAADEDAETLEYISLEELNYIFGVPTRAQVKYQAKKWLPWAYRYGRWKLRTIHINKKVYDLPEKPTLGEDKLQWTQRKQREKEERLARQRELQEHGVADEDADKLPGVEVLETIRETSPSSYECRDCGSTHIRSRTRDPQQ